MLNFTKICFSAMAFLMLAGGNLAFAQEGQAPAADAAPAAKEADLPKIEETRYFNAWRVDCFDRDFNGVRCQLQQQLQDNQSKQLILQIVLFNKRDDNSFNVFLRLPLGFNLKQRAGIKVGDYEEKFDVSFCLPDGCFIESKISEEMRAAFGRGDKATAEIYNRDGNKVGIPFSLLGFTKGYNYLVERN